MCRTLLLLMLLSQSAMAQEPSQAEAQSIPHWAAITFGKELAKDYALSVRLNPFLLHGDFDGDGNLDVAILVERRDTGTKGVAVLHAGSKHPLLLGAGHAIGNGGADFSWMDAWSVLPKGPVQLGADESPPPRLLGDALLVTKLESASAIVYWDGNAYRWYQQGD